MKTHIILTAVLFAVLFGATLPAFAMEPEPVYTGVELETSVLFDDPAFVEKFNAQMAIFEQEENNASALFDDPSFVERFNEQMAIFAEEENRGECSSQDASMPKQANERYGVKCED